MQLQVGVKVLLKNTAGKILIIKRSEEKYGKTNGQWDIPGGRINPGSPLLDNLSREVLEETNLTITSSPRLIAAQDILVYADTHVVRLTYVARADGEVVLDTTENTQYRWVSIEELSREENLDVYVKALLEEGSLQESAWDH